MARVALVDRASRKVLNVVRVERGAAWEPPEGCLPIPTETAGGPGDTWDGEAFIPESPPKSTPSIDERLRAIEERLSIE